MSRILKGLVGVVIVGGLLLALPSEQAQAGGWGFSYSSGYGGYGGYNGLGCSPPIHSYGYGSVPYYSMSPNISFYSGTPGFTYFNPGYSFQGYQPHYYHHRRHHHHHHCD